jgi:preprotein translocase subunit SecG
MATFLLIVHVIVCFFLIFIVLLQSGKGAELGAAFGGSNQTIFGSRGAATFLNKLTTVATVVKKIPVTEERRSIPATSGPVQGGSTQPVQPAQQQGPQTQQKVPLTPQQTPTK